MVRILSLLPSATEIVYALGLEDDLVGVTHECDWPAGARGKRRVSFSTFEGKPEPAEVDRLVSASIGEGEPIYRLDTDAIRELRPDLVLTQDLCAVCAVPSGHVNEALETLGCRADVVSLDPNSLEDVLDCVLQVGTATGSEERALELVDGLRDRLAKAAESGARRDRPRTFALEWSDPPFNGGHWVPEMIDLAGGDPILGSRGTPSVRLKWEEIASASPDVVFFMPCGYDLEAAVEEAASLVDKPELESADAFFAVDASSYFSRPGPRLVDGVEILLSALHPEAAPDIPPNSIRQIR